ncbi:T6SS effector BTH_I2691 family protein [Vreelandella songnenensis]|uniref:T6SS effector BTH_I2691 family protein n=1 Tax=Vreelandella songnenensis TaxID=1176243 RepID=UPI002446877C|nr:T6SS effector BTH_I2691 family protein [Halomonas songnenensis]
MTYPTYVSIAMAYSSMKWTERIREYVLENDDVRQRIMRSFSLISAINATGDCASFAPHAAPITQLGQHVADITPNGAVDGFTSTTVSTIEREEAISDSDSADEAESVYRHLEVKPEITQDSVLGSIDNHDESIFVALDDDLGIVNDLHMALAGREMELEAFLDEHGHKLQIASVLQTLCDYLDDDNIPDDVRDDPAKTARARQLTEDLKQVLSGETYSTESREQRVIDIYDELEALGIEPPDPDVLNATSLLRDDVHYEEAIDYIHRHQPQLERLQTHIENSLADLIIWLERLPLSAQELCFDTVDADQNQAIHECGCMAMEAVGATQTGRAWLNTTYQARDSLIGFAMGNFDPALTDALETIAQHFIEHGTEDGKPADNGVSASSVAERTEAFRGILKYEQVQNHAIYKALAPHVRAAFDTLREGVRGPTQKIWESISYHFLASLGAGGQVSLEKTAKALWHPVMVVLIHPDLASSRLVLDLEYEIKLREWHDNSRRIIRQIKEANDQGNINRANRLEQQRHQHAYDKPNRVAAADDTLDLDKSGNQIRASNLATAGLYEQRTIERLRFTDGANAARRHIAGFIERMGGGMPLLIAGLNLYNFKEAARTADEEGIDAAGAKNLAANAGFAVGATMSLWIMPFWNKHATRQFMLSGGMIAVTEASITEWAGEGRHQAARLAGKLATRVAGLSAIGAISAGLDTWKSASDISSATSTSERVALFAKMGAGGVMAGTAAAQIAGATAARSYAFAWILGGWVSGVLFAAGVIHLVASYFAARFHREGVRLWLYTSIWGRGGYKWDESDEGQNNEWRALMETLLRPSVKLTQVSRTTFDMSHASNNSPGEMSTTYYGYWLQISFPASLAGDTVSISEIGRDGFWAPSDSFERSPHQPGEQGTVPTASLEYESDDVRVWQAWVPASEQEKSGSFTLTVEYSETLLSSGEDRLRFTFYKPDASAGKKEIEPNGEENRGISAPTRFALTVPLTPEE